MGHVYIQTNKFYTIPRYEAYHQTKREYIQAIDPAYDNKQTGEKWTLLMTRLANSLNEDHIPNGLQVGTFRERLAGFKTTREGTSNSQFNVSLTQCVNYFEEFNFLYNTTDPRYKLTDAAKKDLLTSINEAMGVCETGLNGRLYTALQAHQKESDWIQNELVKARCETLRMLHTQYGGGNHDVHSYNALVHLANNAQLGIPQQEAILDAHAGIVDSSRLTAFFNEHYPVLFATYEKQMEDNLTNHYLSELTTKLAIDSAQWSAGTVTIPFIQTRDISDSITAYFQGARTDHVLYALGDLSDDDYTEYTLKSKEEVAKIIKGLVAQKLIVDQYLVSLDDIANDRTAHPNLRLKTGVVLDELIDLHNALKEHDLQQINDKLHQNPVILMSYPELVINHIDSNPAILSNVPRWLRANTRFIDSSMAVLNQLLCDAISAHNEDAIRNLTAQILNLIQSEYGYLQQLSKPVFTHPIVAKMLIEKNGLLFAYLNDALQNDSDLRAQAEGQHLFGAYHTNAIINKGVDMILGAHFNARRSLPYQYRNEPSLALSQQNVPIHRAIANFLRIKAFIALLTPGTLTLREVCAHVNDLNPDLLLKVIHYRKINHLPPLPFFDNENTCKDLEKFNQELTDRLDPDWSHDYLSIKRRACEQENFAFIRDPFAVKNAVTFLSKADRWFAGFNQYHTYQSNNEKLWARLMIAARALCDLVITMAKIGLYVAAIYYVYPVIYAIVQLYIVPATLTYFCLWLVNIFLQNSLIATVNDVIWRLVTLDAEFLLAMIFNICFQIMPLYTAIIGTLDAPMAILGMLTNVFSYLTSKNEYLAGTLEDTCENTVVRLEGINEASAQDKADLLRALLTQMKTEVSSEQGHSFTDLLDKKYPNTYQGATHNVSFSDVASKRRPHDSALTLDDQPDRMRFFSGRTTTEALLATVEPSLQMA